MSGIRPGRLLRFQPLWRGSGARFATQRQSLIATLAVMSSILRARQVEDVPAPHIGQEAVIRLGRAVQSKISAQNDLFRSHNALVDAKTLITGAPGHDDTLAYMEASEEVRQVAA